MAGNNVRKLILLVVDDDPSIVRYITTVVRESLSELMTVVAFTDPVEACLWIDENCCDIVISDIEMPSIDGLRLLPIVKKRNAWTQVIFMTAHSTWDRIAEAVEQGASDYLVKPLVKQDVIDVLQHHRQRFLRWQSAVLTTLSTPSPSPGTAVGSR
jgi:DNA-binding NtrC family response regulator